MASRESKRAKAVVLIANITFWSLYMSVVQRLREVATTTQVADTIMSITVTVGRRIVVRISINHFIEKKMDTSGSAIGQMILFVTPHCVTEVGVSLKSK